MTKTEVKILNTANRNSKNRISAQSWRCRKSSSGLRDINALKSLVAKGYAKDAKFERTIETHWRRASTSHCFAYAYLTEKGVKALEEVGDFEAIK